MNTPITASFRWSRDEFVGAQRLALRHSGYARGFRPIVAIVGTIVVLSGVVRVYQHTLDWSWFVFALGFAGVVFGMPLFTRRAVLKLYADKPDRDMEVRWEASENGIKTGTELATSENTWAFFQKVIRVPQGFLLYSSKTLFHWLPLHAFRNAEEAERFAELAKSKIKDYIAAG